MRLATLITLEAAAGALAMAALRTLSAFNLSKELTGLALLHTVKGTSTHLDMYLYFVVVSSMKYSGGGNNYILVKTVSLM